MSEMFVINVSTLIDMKCYQSCSNIIIFMIIVNIIIIANAMLIAHLFGQIVVEARLPAPVAGQEALLYWECQLQILKQNLSYLLKFFPPLW